MKNTNQIEKTAKAAIWILALILGSTICNAQTAAPISAGFSKAAITSLVAIHSGPASDISAKALIDAEAIAASPAEEAVVKQLKAYAFAGVMASLDRQTAAVAHLAAPDSKDDACYTAWKASLRNLDSVQPTVCK